MPLTFTALKTALPRPDAAYGLPLESVGRRGKYLLLQFEPVTFVVHLMQGGRLLVDEKQSAKPRNGQAGSCSPTRPALLLTEAGTERRAGVWCIANGELDGPPLDRLGPEALDVTAESLAESFAKTQHAHPRVPARPASDRRARPDAGQRGLPPRQDLAVRDDRQARRRRRGGDRRGDPRGGRRGPGVRAHAARHELVEGPSGRVHGRVGEPCPVCGDTIRSVAYSGYTVAYCPTCQTGGKVLADNTTSKFLK